MEKDLTDGLTNKFHIIKGSGWEVKNDITDGSNLTEGKGQLIKYARA